MSSRIHPFDPSVQRDDWCKCHYHKDHLIHKTDRTATDGAAQTTAANAFSDISSSIERFERYVKGRRVRILANRNDQPFGRSKPTMKDSVEVVTRAGWNVEGMYLMLEGRKCGVKVYDVEFIER